MRNGIKRSLLSMALVVCVAAALASGAFAVDENFKGVPSAEFYPSTEYATSYGAEYIYGGQNVIDFVDVQFPYGFSDGTAIGAAERVILPRVAEPVSGAYGIQATVFETPTTALPVAPAVNDESVKPYVYQLAAYTSIQGMERADGSIGTVRIPSLGIDMKVWEGETNASMAKGLGHYSSTSAWDGNVCVCGHNRGASYVIGSIKDLEIGDTVTYMTVYGTRTYAVSYVGVISYTDWSHLQATADNRITLTTCLANQPSSRVCVQAVEVV